ncbi:flagellar export chaperone FliS [bacterium]|nr:flagellar export chaperone FliS [bacterium]
MIPRALNAQYAYRQMQTETAGPEETVVLLFDGMVRILYRARDAMSAGRLEEQSAEIGRAQRILSELSCALDSSQDEALVGALRCTYTSMYNRLCEANLSDDLAALEDVLALAERFSQAWRTALQSVGVATVTPASL